MLGTPSLVVTSTEGGTPPPHEGGSGGAQPMIGGDGGGGGGGSSGGGGDLFEGDRSTGGNRWPRQETLALLKIRSDMDVTFRDSSLKGPLWEEVSRKMGELGYHRSAKKCKEKFENVYKYHKRTKDGRVGKAEGKTYRFFDQLQALEQHHHQMALNNSTSSSSPSLPPPLPHHHHHQVTHQSSSQAPALDAVPVTMVMPAGTGNPVPVTVTPAGTTGAGVTVTSTSHPTVSVIQTSSPSTAPIIQQQQQQQQQQVSVNPTSNSNHHHHTIVHQVQQSPHQVGTMSGSGIQTRGPIQMENLNPNAGSGSGSGSPSATQSSSSMTSSDEEVMGMRRKRKRKWKDYFEKLMKEVIDKQEELQKRFLEAVEKRENDRVAREESWKLQEMERLNREHDILVQERSIAAAKDSALIAFLQKLSDQQNIPLPLPPQAQAQVQAQTQTQAQAQTQVQVQTLPQVQTQTPQPLNMVESQGPPLKQPRLQPPPPPQTQPQPQPQAPPQPPLVTPGPLQTPPHLQQAMVVMNPSSNNGENVMEKMKSNNNGDNINQTSSSRWPKAEIQTLINLRTSLDQKYQENGPKGPLWEEISSLMKKHGYNRNAKRCKEKWENINKYYKKVKEQNKKRPEDSKTCPYFHQLDALYKSKTEISKNPVIMNNQGNVLVYEQQNEMKNEGNVSTSSMAEINVQQWPQMRQSEQTIMEDQGSESEDDGDDDDEDDDDQGRGYEIVPNNNNNNTNNNNSINAQ